MTRCLKAAITRDEQRAVLCVGPGNSRGGRVGDVVQRGGVAIAGEEEVVDAIAGSDGWAFDEGPVALVAVEDLDGVSDFSLTVGRVDLLQHDGGGDDGLDGVATAATVANAIAVYLVRDPAATVAVLELARVDVSALVDIAGPCAFCGDEGALGSTGGGRTDTVLTWTGGVSGSEIQDKSSVILYAELEFFGL
jgi:hypothetical protein